MHALTPSTLCDPHHKKHNDMSTELNKQTVRRFYEAIQRVDYAAAAQLCHPDFVFYLQMDTPIHGADGFIASEKKNFDAFPGFCFHIERMVAEGDQVAAYLVFDGEHTSGVIDGIAPAGKRLRFSLLMLLTISEGKIIEKRAHFDRMDIRRQLSGEP
ncbi:ester cyclase [Ralstonia pseudosolanacearum]